MNTASDHRWMNILQNLEPLYFKWKDILEKGPKIITEIYRSGNWWCVHLQEELLPNVDHPVWENPGKLDERVNWTMDQLEDWPQVKRMAHDMWYFKRKRDAEKFQTLYNLRWAAE